MNFEEDMDPYKALNIGFWNRKFKVGDSLKIKQDLYYNYKYNYYTSNAELNNEIRFYKNNIIILSENERFYTYPNRGYFIKLDWILDNTELFEKHKIF